MRQVEAQCGTARVVSDHRPGATIAGTRRVSQHAACNGQNGAIDAVFANRACALSALRQTNYTILTYRSSPHIHIGTDGWGSGGTRVAQRQPARIRTAANRRTGGHAPDSQWASAASHDGQWAGEAASSEWSSARAMGSDWSNAGTTDEQWSGRGTARGQRAYARASGRQRAGVRAASHRAERVAQPFDGGERLW